MNYDEMKAGSELDAVVAEQIFNGSQASFYDGGALSYSTNISEAWRIVESRPLGTWNWRISQDDNGVWWAEIRLGFSTSYNRALISFAPTAPLAIARAALKAVSPKEGK